MPYQIKKRQEAKARSLNFTIKPSTRKTKKIDVFDSSGSKVASIGGIRKDGRAYMDYASYLQTEDKATADKKRQAYLKRHAKDPKTKNGKPSPSRLSDVILWS